MFLFRLITKPIGCLCSLIFGGVLVLFVLALLVFWGMSASAPEIMEGVVESKTGFPSKVQSASLGLLSDQIYVENWWIDNPARFKETTFARVREFSVDADLQSAWSDALVVREVVLNVESLHCVQSSDAGTNATEFLRNIFEKSKTATDVEGQQEPITIEKMTVRLDQVVFVDFTSAEPVRKVVELNYERSFYDVTDIARDIGMLVAQDFSKTEAWYLARCFLDSIEHENRLDVVKEKLESAVDELSEQVDSVGKGVKNFFENLKE